jgi:hypothetical protein
VRAFSLDIEREGSSLPRRRDEVALLGDGARGESPPPRRHLQRQAGRQPADGVVGARAVEVLDAMYCRLRAAAWRRSDASYTRSSTPRFRCREGRAATITTASRATG